MKLTKSQIKQTIREAASEYVWGIKNPGRVANKYKISALKLKQLIKEEIEKELEEKKANNFSDYERDDISTDHQMVMLLQEIVSQLKTMNYFLTPAKTHPASGLEKAIAGYQVQEDKGESTN